MARKINNLAEVKVYINGKEQAKRDLEELTKQADEFKTKIDETRKSIADNSAKMTEAEGRANASREGTAEHSAAVKDMLEAQKAIDKAQIELKNLENGQKQLRKVIRETEKFAKDLAEDLDNLSGQNIARLKEMMRQLDAIRNKLDPETDKDGTFLDYLNDAYNRVMDTIKNKKGDLVEFADIMDDLTNIDDTSLAKAEQRLRSLLAATDKDDVERIKQLKDELDKTVGEKNRRIGVEAQSIIGGNYTHTIEGTKQAIKFLEKYQDTLDATNTDAIEEVTKAINKMNAELETAVSKKAEKVMKNPLGFSVDEINEAIKYTEKLQASTPDGKEWTKYAEQIDNAKKIRDQFADDAKMKIMADQFIRLNDLSENALAEQKKYWEGVMKSAEKGTAEYILAESKLKQIIDLDNSRMKNQSKETLTTNLNNAGTADIKKSVEWLEKYKGTLQPLGREWEEVNKLIKAGNDRLKELSDSEKMTAMADQFARLAQLSENALAEQKKYWEDVLKNAEKGTAEYALAEGKLKQIIDLNNSRMKQTSRETLTTNLNTAGSEDIKKAVDWLTKYQGTLQPLSKEWKEVNKEIADGNARLKEISNESKMEVMNQQLGKLRTLSKDALTQQKSFWQAMIDGARAGSKEAEQYQKNLKLVEDQMDETVRRTNQDLVKSILHDNWEGSISQSKEALKALQEYKESLKATDTNSIRRVNDAIEALTNKTKLAEAGIKDIDSTLKVLVKSADNLGKGDYKGSVAGLESMRKKLIAIRDAKNQVLGAEDREKLEKALRNVNKELAIVKGEAVDVSYVLDHMKDTPLWKLEKAAKQLQEEIRDCSESTGEFAEKAAELRKVNAQIDKLKKQFKDTENVVIRTAKRLAAYVAIYGGFNAIVDKMKEMVGLNLQLSDSLADVQKTTGLTGIELQELGRSLGAIDTRTATTELYNLAAAAGQIGLKTQEDVLGFAKAANVISVALNELGAEGSATITKIATLTGDVARSGTEDALLKVGSAINELTANSAATAGPIADFISRIGGIASASGIAIHEMAALGAATDASAQSIEIAGTSMNKFITALLSNTENIAYAANLSVDELNALINQGDTMQAVIRVLEAMKSMSREGQSAVLKELGSEGARMNQYVASMVANLDMLKRQLTISREAFHENVSVVNEYNVKQESAIGILQRMKNSFLDTFVNSKMVDVLKNILQFIANIPRDLEKFPVLLGMIKTAIMAIIVMKIPLLLDRLAMQLSGLYALLRGPFLAALASFQRAWKQAELSVVFAGKAVTGFTGFLRVLWGVIKANPIGLAVTAVTAFVVAMQSANAEAKRLSKITADLSEKQGRQLDELKALRTAMDDSNASYADRAGAMKEINQMYSKFLGFEIRELEVYEKKAAALELIVAKLKEQQAIEMKRDTQEFFNEEFSKNTSSELETISGILASIPEITSKRVPEAIRVMNEAIEGGAESTEELFKALDKYFNSDISSKFSTLGEMFKVRTGTETDKGIFDFLTDAYDEEQFEDYIEEYKKRRQGLLVAEENYNHQSEKAIKEAHEKRIALAEAQAKRIAELQAEGDKESEAEQVDHLRNMLREQEEYLVTLEALRKEYKEKDDQFVRSNIHQEDGTVEKFNLEREYGILAYVEGTKLDNIARKRIQVVQEAISTQNKLEAEQAKLQQERLKENNESVIAETEKNIRELDKKHKELNTQKVEYDQQWQEQYSRLLQFTVSDEREANGEKIKAAKQAIEDLNFNIEKDPYGKALNLKDWKQFDAIIANIDKASPKSLINAFKKLNEDYQKFADNLPALNKMFEFKVPMRSLDEAQTQIFDWANQLRDELQRRGLTTTGATIFQGLVGEVDSQLDIIKVKFAKQQKEIKDAYLSGSITSEEMNRRIVENDREMMNERLQLRRMLLSEDHSFHASLYPEMDKEYLNKLKRRLVTANSEVITTLRQAMEEDANAISEDTIKQRERFEKALAEGDPFSTLRDNFRSSLDELLLMSSQFERDMARDLDKAFKDLGEGIGDKYMGLDKESQQERLDFLIELSQKSYTVDRDGLRKMFESHGEYYNWVTHLDDQKMDVMLNKLQWFYDESLLKQRAYADRLIKAQESAYEQQGLKYDDVAKLQWERQNLINQRAALQAQNSLVTSEPADPSKRAKNESDILSHTQAINRLDEQILEAQKKAADKNKSFRSKQERETKEQMEASISALQAYYNEMEALIRKQGLENKWTPEDIERKVLANKIAAERDEIELRKKLLGELSTFDPNANNGYKGVITGHEFFGTNKTEANLKKQAEQIKVWGKALVDGMRNMIAKGEIEIAEDMQKVQDKIKKALLEGDMFGKFESDFADMLDEMGVLTSEFEDAVNQTLTAASKEKGENFIFGLSQEEQTRRISELTQFAEQSYQINEQGLKDLMMQNTQFADWVQWMSDDEMSVLLQKLRGYYDDRLAMTKRYQEQMKKEFEAYYEQSGMQNSYERQKQSIDASKAYQSGLEGYGVRPDYDKNRENIAKQTQLDLDKKDAELEAYEDKWAAANDKLFKASSDGNEEQLRVAQSEMQAAWDAMAQAEIERNELLAQSQRDLTQVYMDEWTKRAERWGQWGEMFGEYLGEQVMLEKQANDARARGDLETAKKIEQQQKQNKQALIQNLLSKIVDEAALWAKEYALKMMFNSLMLAEDKKKAIEEATLQGKSSMLSILLNALTGQSKEHAKGIPGLVTGAIIFAATMALQAFAKSAIANMFPEAATESTGTRKLSTGMLTYAEGNYPVLGNDGKVYDAKYEGAGMKTGVYGGGAHFGIFSEKQPEMIVDGKTTQKLILNYPYIYDAITTIAKNGRLKNAMPTFATGDYPAGMKQLAPIAEVDASAGGNEEMIQMRATMDRTNATIDRLSRLLEGGITAHLDGLETHRQQKKNERFLKRRGID